jgi:hypothetical protein
MTVAHVVHQLPGRLRLRIPEHRNNEGFFDELAERLRAADEIDRVSRDAMTATLLIRHRVPENRLLSFLEDLLGLAFEAAPPPNLSYGLAPVGATIKAVNHSLRRASGGTTDLRVVLFVLLVALAVRQLTRGQIMVPAAALLWNAFELALRFSSED